MKLRKFISVLLALTIFVALSSVSYAAPAANSNPIVNISFASQNSSGVCFFPVTLTGGDTLNLASNSVYDEEEDENITTYTGTGINALEFHVTLDPTVFDVSTSTISNLPSGATYNGQGTSTLDIVFTSGITFNLISSYSNYLFRIRSKLNSGYTKETIPNSAMTITSAKIEYTSYNNAKAVGDRNTYTIYGYNTTGTKDYEFVASFTGTASDEDPAPVVAEKNDTTGIVTLTRNANATLPASAVLDGQKIKLFTNKFDDVTANTRFQITHKGVTKTFGATIGSYLGISGSGTLSGTLGVAVLFDEKDDNTEFTISKVN